MQNYITAGNLLHAYIVANKSACDSRSELRRSFERVGENELDGGKNSDVAMRYPNQLFLLLNSSYLCRRLITAAAPSNTYCHRSRKSRTKRGASVKQAGSCRFNTRLSNSRALCCQLRVAVDHRTRLPAVQIVRLVAAGSCLTMPRPGYATNRESENRQSHCLATASPNVGKIQLRRTRDGRWPAKTGFSRNAELPPLMPPVRCLGLIWIKPQTDCARAQCQRKEP
jgi:hypothetical protein